MAQSWLANGGFDGNTGGWEATPRNTSSFGYFNAANGYTNVGTAGIIVGFHGDDIAFTQCVDMTPQNVDLVFYSKVIQTGGGPNIGTGSVSFFSMDACAGGYLDNRDVTTVESLAGDWKRQTLLDVAAPAATRSARVLLRNRIAIGYDTSANVVFDDVGFGPTGSFYTPVVTANRLANADFAFDITQWTTVAQNTASSSTRWRNVSGYGGIGGALGLVANGAEDRAGVQQCVNIDAQVVDLQAYSRIDYGDGANTGTLSVSSFGVPDCAASYIENREAPVVSTDAAGWRRFLLRDYALPATTRSAMVFFTVAMEGAGAASVSMAVDHVGFGPAGTFADGLYQDRFE